METANSYPPNSGWLGTSSVLEAIAVEGYRSGTITPAQVQRCLACAPLGYGIPPAAHRGVYHDHTMDDLERDIAAIRDASRQ